MPVRRPPASILAIHYTCELSLPAGWSLPAHSHAERNEALLILDGEIETHMEGVIHRGRPGALLMYPCGVIHEERAVAGPLRMLFLAWSDSARVRGIDLPRLVDDPTGRIDMAFHWILSFREEQPDRPELASALLEGLFHEQTRCAKTAAGNRWDRVRTHVRTHLAGQLSVAELARSAGLSPFHFSRAFRAEFGVTPMRFVRESRVEATRALLMSSPMPLRAIAPLVGFSDEFQLCHVFRRVTGRTPGQLRGSRYR